MNRFLIYGPFCHHQPRPSETSSEKGGSYPFKNTSIHAGSAPPDLQSEAPRRGAGRAGFVNGAAEGGGKARGGAAGAVPGSLAYPSGSWRRSRFSSSSHTYVHTHTYAHSPLPKVS